jgi:copper(I)-binding protein
MTRSLLIVPVALFLALAAAACGDDGGGASGETGTGGEAGMEEDTIHVADAWARSPSEDVGAVYFQAHNGAGVADRLIGVSTPAAGRAEIHEMVERGGEMVMQPVGPVTIGPDETVAFEPGGYHVMLFNLTEPLAVDSTISVTLEFENAGEIQIEALVKPYVPEEGMGMGGEDGMGMTGPTGSTAPADMG